MAFDLEFIARASVPSAALALCSTERHIDRTVGIAQCLRPQAERRALAASGAGASNGVPS